GAHHVHLLSIATLILVLCGSASAQFTVPTPFPVCAGTTANFNATASGRSYIWTFENTPVNFSLTSLPSSSVVHAGTPLSVPGYTTIDVESGKWISFVTNYSANEIIRMEYGTSPLNSPSLTSIGTGFGTGN